MDNDIKDRLSTSGDMSTTIWQDRITSELLLQRDRLSPTLRKRLKIDLMQRIINRTIEFTPKCETCRKNQTRLSEITAALTFLTPASKLEIGKHLQGIKELSTHLTKTHKLVKPGQIIITLLLFGLPLSKSAQNLLDSRWAGIMVGIVAAVVLGLIIESVLRAKGKML